MGEGESHSCDGEWMLNRWYSGLYSCCMDDTGEGRNRLVNVVVL